MNTSTTIHILRVLGWLEGGSFLLLMFVGMPLKYLAGNPAIVKALGMPHGILFIAYVVMANMMAEELNWSLKVRAYVLLAAIFPFGTFIFERQFLKKTI